MSSEGAEAVEIAEVVDALEPVAPELPLGAALELPGRGTTYVRSLPGPDGAPAVLLLHGWTASADLNFHRNYAALAEHCRVVAIDHRGHGRGIRSRRIFRLEDCADDAIAACDQLGIDRVIAIGYSMGGAVAQLAWRRHPDRVAGLVLCATAARFSTSRQDRLNFLGLSGLAALARLTPAQARRWLTAQMYLQRKAETWEPWAVEQAAGHDWRLVLEAGRRLGAFDARAWLGEVDVPTSVVITMRDHVVPVSRQIELFEEIPGAEAFRVDADHDAPVAASDRFNAALVRAVQRIGERIAGG